MTMFSEAERAAKPCADCPPNEDFITPEMVLREVALMRRDLRDHHFEMALSFALLAGMLAIIYYEARK
jgi:hypothetical protein